MLVAIIIWLLLAIVIGVAAARRGRSGLGWLFLSLLLSPLVAAIVLALMPDRRYQEVVERLAAYDHAGAQVGAAGALCHFTASLRAFPCR